MRYIIFTIMVRKYFISWSESELQYLDGDVYITQVTNFFSTKAEAISNVRNQLEKEGVKKEEIIIV